MTENSLNKLDPSWSKLLKNIVSADTSHSSPRKLKKLKKEELVTLRKLVATTKTTNAVHPGKAISALVEQSPTKEVANLLDKVISDQERPQSQRAIAAIEIRRLPETAAEKVLLKHLAAEEPIIQFRVIQSLGRIGWPKALKQLKALSEPKDLFVRQQWDFSKRLIQYRHGLKTRDPLRLSGTNWSLDSGIRPIPLLIGQLDRKQLKACLSTLKNKTLGVELSDNPKFTLNIGANSYLILDKRLAKKTGMKHLAETPAISGVVTVWNERSKSAELSQFMLTTPYNRGVLIHSYRLDGSLRFEGSGSIVKGVFYFTLTSCEQPGQCLYRITAEYKAGGIEIDRAEKLNLIPSKQTQPLNG